MKKIKQLKTSLLSLVLGSAILTGCTSSSIDSTEEIENPVSETIDITVSILPQKYFVEKIAGDSVKINVMVKPGSEPATYEPLPEQLRALSEAEAYISIGVPFENSWLERFKSTNPDLVMIDSAEGIEKIAMVAHSHHEHGENHSHQEEEETPTEETLDPHIWLSPELVKIQAQNIYQGLVEIDPTNQAEYQANLETFIAEIEQIDQQIRQNLAGVENRQFIVFHPAWGYFARNYNLIQVPIEVGGQEPSAAELAELVKEAKEENIKVIFAQYQFNSQDAQIIAQEIKGKVIYIDPLDPNWSENLIKVSETFSEVLKSQNLLVESSHK